MPRTLLLRYTQKEAKGTVQPISIATPKGGSKSKSLQFQKRDLKMADRESHGKQAMGAKEIFH